MHNTDAEVNMRSFFIGAGIVLALVPLAPLTMLWVIGERHQGRHGIHFATRQSPDGTTAGVTLIISTILSTIAWVILAAVLGAS